ncbi:hypothetical protein QVD17_37741 [Tagetes erecta]|uniref:Uncharacterized protein n=1 Tax=Tagetes erecta TaxID=13708 RepID=A0AAD8NCY4_TARER|nr:hypothetical protein QVD17_37741 [Tagetes erecta]
MSTSFVAIPDTDEIPTTYFNFAGKNRMLAACDREDQVIDYIGYIIKIDYAKKRDENPYVVMTLRGCEPTIQCAVEPRIIAATSVKVRRFMHQLKLQSSAATYVYLNPLTVEYSQLLELYQSGSQPDASAYQNLAENTKATIKELTVKSGKQINTYLTRLGAALHVKTAIKM